MKNLLLWVCILAASAQGDTRYTNKIYQKKLYEALTLAKKNWKFHRTRDYIVAKLRRGLTPENRVKYSKTLAKLALSRDPKEFLENLEYRTTVTETREVLDKSKTGVPGGEYQRRTFKRTTSFSILRHYQPETLYLVAAAEKLAKDGVMLSDSFLGLKTVARNAGLLGWVSDRTAEMMLRSTRTHRRK